MRECDCPSYYAKEDAPLVDWCPIHGIYPLGRPDEWIQANGEIVQIKAMTLLHRKNIIELLKRWLVTDESLFNKKDVGFKLEEFNG